MMARQTRRGSWTCVHIHVGLPAQHGVCCELSWSALRSLGGRGFRVGCLHFLGLIPPGWSEWFLEMGPLSVSVFKWDYSRVLSILSH